MKITSGEWSVMETLYQGEGICVSVDGCSAQNTKNHKTMVFVYGLHLFPLSTLEVSEHA
jgi:hypothetical protein